MSLRHGLQEAAQAPPDQQGDLMTAVEPEPVHAGAAPLECIPQSHACGRGKHGVVVAMRDEDRYSGHSR